MCISIVFIFSSLNFELSCDDLFVLIGDGANDGANDGAKDGAKDGGGGIDPSDDGDVYASLNSCSVITRPNTAEYGGLLGSYDGISLGLPGA